MATARKLPSGKYRCMVYTGKDANGKRQYKSFTAETKKESEFMASQFMMSKNRRIEKRHNKTFAHELSEYISRKTAVLSPSTIKGYKNIERMLQKNYPAFYNKLCSDITQEDIQNVVSDLSKTKSPKTVRNYHGLISAILGSDMKIKTTLPQRIVNDLYIPSDDEIKNLINIVKNTELEIPVLLGAFCMMRRGEICALSLNDIKGNTIHVKHSMVLTSDKEWQIKAPKTVSSDRYIQAPDFVIKKIKEKGYITNLNPHSISIMFGRVLEKNNLPHFRFHDLRHYSASIRHALGIPDAYIMADGGWSSDKVLKAVYRHAMSDRKREMAGIANAHFETLI